MKDLTHEARAKAKQISEALATLKPTMRKRAAAKEEIEQALKLIDEVVASDKDLVRSRQSRKVLGKMIKTLMRCEHLARTLAKDHSEWKERPLDLSEHIDRCQEDLVFRKRPPRRTAPRQKLAAFMARELIEKYRPDDEKATALTRGGIWHRLSKILAGRGDPLNHMRAINRLTDKQKLFFQATLGFGRGGTLRPNFREIF